MEILLSGRVIPKLPNELTFEVLNKLNPCSREGSQSIARFARVSKACQTSINASCSDTDKSYLEVAKASCRLFDRLDNAQSSFNSNLYYSGDLNERMKALDEAWVGYPYVCLKDGRVVYGFLDKKLQVYPAGTELNDAIGVESRRIRHSIINIEGLWSFNVTSCKERYFTVSFVRRTGDLLIHDLKSRELVDTIKLDKGTVLDLFECLNDGSIIAARFKDKELGNTSAQLLPKVIDFGKLQSFHPGLSK